MTARKKRIIKFIVPQTAVNFGPSEAHFEVLKFIEVGKFATAAMFFIPLTPGDLVHLRRWTSDSPYVADYVVVVHAKFISSSGVEPNLVWLSVKTVIRPL